MKTIKRSPRILPDLPEGKVEIATPPSPPNKPTSSLTTILIPIGGLVLSMAIMIITSSTGSGLGIGMLFSVPMMLGTGIVSLVNYRNQRNKYTKEKEKRQQNYQRHLESQKNKLVKMHQQQQKALREIDPAPKECLTRVSQMDSGLWERSPNDFDFLCLRLGLGNQPLSVEIKLPRIDPTHDPDPLVEEAHKVGKSFEMIHDVPVNFPIKDGGAGGITGKRPDVLNLTRTLLVQLATHHAPTEVKIIAVFPASEHKQWDWARWLPHVWISDRQKRLLASNKDEAHELLMALYNKLQTRKRSLEATQNINSYTLPVYVIILADSTLGEGEPVLPLLLQQGKTLGAYTIFLGNQPDDLPQGCQIIAHVDNSSGKLIYTQNKPKKSFNPDHVTLDMADRFARAMAPLRVKHMSSEQDVPSQVTLLDALNVDRVEDLNVSQRWKNSKPQNTLAVPIGKKAGGDSMLLDIHAKAHGPHGLGAGTTGSGKSELLQSFIAALSINYHPHELTFVIVDYKGGGMSNAFANLPHLVGTITNLKGNLAARALRALKAELERRQALLANAGENNIDDYLLKYRTGELDQPMPHLVLVVDEFAELATQMPDFMKELVSAARLGRSLGVHLILTTQKPSGVVSEQIWSNSRFRFCLRVERTEDSRDVLKRPDAASLTRPGQAFLQVGNNEIFEQFQSAWSGAQYLQKDPTIKDPHEIFEVALDGTRCPLQLTKKEVQKEKPISQLEAVVNHLCQISVRQEIHSLPGPWLPPLPEHLALSKVRTDRGWNGRNWQSVDTWINPVIGLLDDPEHQRQHPLQINLGEEGHLAIYGAPGTGKTTLLKTMITSLALDHSPKDLNLYLLDYGARILTLFRDLPGVGGVITKENEKERLQRLLGYLLRQIETRKELFSKEGVSNLEAYRQGTGKELPAIALIIDNYPGFTSSHPKEEKTIGQIAQEGGNLGIHLIFTANSPAQVRMHVTSNITMAVSFELADRADYTQVVGRTTGLEFAPIPGRGLIKDSPPKEFQTALPVPGTQEAERTWKLKQLIASMTKWDGPRAQPIPVPPKVVSLSNLLKPTDNYRFTDENKPFLVPLGLDLDDLEPLQINLADGPNFLISGPPQSGKTTLLQSWILALAECFPPEHLQLYLVDFQQEGLYPFRVLPHTQAYITNASAMEEAITDIEREIQSRRKKRDHPKKSNGDVAIIRQRFPSQFTTIVMVIDDFDLVDFQAQTNTQERLNQIIKRNRGLGFHLILASSITDLTTGFSNVIRTMKNLPAGFLLGSSDSSHLNVFNIRLPVGDSGHILPAGEGYYAHRGKQRKAKIATPWEGETPIEKWIRNIINRN